jgi:hypothetical protein
MWIAEAVVLAVLKLATVGNDNRTHGYVACRRLRVFHTPDDTHTLEDLPRWRVFHRATVRIYSIASLQLRLYLIICHFFSKQRIRASSCSRLPIILFVLLLI